MKGAEAQRHGGARARRHGLLRHVTIIAIILCASAPLRPCALGAQSLPKRLDRRLDAAPFDRAFWGVAVVDQKGKLVYGRNEHRLFTPASNAKLVVSAVGAALLPPDLTVRTSLYAAGPIKDGVLQGDLVLYGRGDPTLGVRCYGTDTLREGACDRDPFARLRALAEGLRAKGVRVVQGDLVGDGSYFEPLLVHPGWEQFDLNWWYAAPVSGLGFHDNSIDFTWAPGTAPGAPALIS
jgi:serine-type D-Ala-D-Ala carboxypeptidase/endopeptidase (penicillin-binding protein 4)